MFKNLYFFLAILLLTTCQNQSPSDELNETSSEADNIIPVPSQQGAEPNLFASSSGQLFLSWIENEDNKTDVLYFSRLVDGAWESPQEIARGDDWFVNWADFPALSVYEGHENHIVAHWLQKRAEGTYDYDVRIAQSIDGGQTWSSSFVPHKDNIPAEHGFVSFLPLSNERMMIAWLDGRNTKTEGGAMTLRTAEIDIDGQLYEEAELDNRICDCCQTGAALTANGPVVVYRDRTDNEIRDISIVRKVNGEWQAPQRVFEDNWLINGCPVNGPAIDADGNRVVVAWFSMAEGEREVKIAFSDDAGATFQEPIRIDSGNPEGRVDVLLMDNGTALVSWLENTEKGAFIQLAKAGDNQAKDAVLTLTATSAKRSSGFPRIAQTPEGLYLAWTAVDGKETAVKTMKVSLDEALSN